MIDLTQEESFPLAQSREYIPSKPGKRISLSTVYRWYFRGVRGIRLETVCVGGARWTSREALSRFFKATTVAADAQLATPTIQNSAEKAQISARQDAADRELTRRGY